MHVKKFPDQEFQECFYNLKDGVNAAMKSTSPTPLICIDLKESYR